MWDEPFSIDILDGSQGVVVNCPNRDLERELASVLGDHGITYPDGAKLILSDQWKKYGEDFCYFIDVPYKTTRRGPRQHADMSEFRSYERYTFFGEQPEYEISDDSFYSIIGG